MISFDDKDLNELANEIKLSFEVKHKALKLNQELTVESKAIIFSIHRNEKSKAKRRLEKLQNLLSKALEKYDITLFKDSIEEFFEAKMFFDVKYNKKLPNRNEIFDLKSINCSQNKVIRNEIINSTYAGALSDLTGELVRYAYALAFKDKIDEIYEIKDFIERIRSFLIKANLTHDLRRKFDAIKYNLDKIIQILYDLEIKRKNK